MISDDEVRSVSRRLRDLVEPLAANVYFAAEAQEGYKALGLSYIPSYFRSRSACMGDVSGEVVVATFGVFNPAIVLPAMEKGRKASVDDITAEHPGFRRAVINDVDLAVGSQIAVNVSLELGQTTDSVEVRAAASEVNVSSASVGSVVESRRILDLPLVGRNAYDLLATQPGVHRTMFLPNLYGAKMARNTPNRDARCSQP